MITTFEESEIFKRVNVTGTDQNCYVKDNIVVGENGSGKTRFLRCVREYCKEVLHIDETKIVYAYFPDVSASVEDKNYEMDYSLYDIFIGTGVPSFQDFLKCVEADNMEFINQILNPNNKRYKQRNEECRQALQNLNDTLSELLDYKILSENGVILLQKGKTSGIEIAKALEIMSPGERMLFYLSVFLVFICKVWGSDDDLIIILDEPELHLHTKALRKFIKLLRSQVKYEQLWIATHSYSLVGQFEFENIIYIEDGVIQKRDSSLYHNIFQSLVGMDDGGLYDFLTDIERWQHYNFIAECFALPESVEKSNPKDIQFQQFLDCIKKMKNKSRIQVLDYGAGKERIATCLKMLETQQKSSLDVDYYSYDPCWEDFCLQNHQFNSIEVMKQQSRKFDCVVLMNVLHEIDVKKWYTEFANINRLIRDGGFLLFVEVETLTHGEQPYGDSGYLILYEEQLKILFGTNLIERIEIGENKSNAFMISKKYINNVTNDGIYNALLSLKSRVFEELKSINKKRIEDAHQGVKSGAQSIRRYAFLSQLYLNSMFAIQQLSGGNPDDESADSV